MALPTEILELICRFLEDADDLASCHMVHTRCARLNVCQGATSECAAGCWSAVRLATISMSIHCWTLTSQGRLSMWCRFCAAARAAMVRAEPQNPGFFELALQHRYPLRHLSIAELPFCRRLDSYLAKVGAGDGLMHSHHDQPPDVISCSSTCQYLSSLSAALVKLMQHAAQLRRQVYGSRHPRA